MPESLPRLEAPASDGTSVAQTGLSAEEEKHLIQRAQSGEPEVFYQLIRPYQRRVYVIALTILKNNADAEDVVQEALLKAFTHLAQFRAESRFSTWLTQIAINEARMKLRKNHLEIVQPIEDHENDDGTYTPQSFTDWREIPSEALERKEVRETLIAALGSLAQKYREVFVLRDVHHVSIEEAAVALGITTGVVKTRLLRARLMLRDLLASGFDGMFGGPSQFPKGTKPWT
jgi:RNA polymerase sigma-70 factor (ECF subfamily)